MESMRLAKQMATVQRASLVAERYPSLLTMLSRERTPCSVFEWLFYYLLSELVYELILILAAVEHTLLGRFIEFLHFLQR